MISEEIFDQSFDFQAGDYPEQPGCYQMKDRDGLVLYVGKSKNLRNRIASYFQKHTKSRHITRLVSRVSEIEIILARSETESLLLENSLIAYHQPPFNRLIWRVKKRYPYLGLTQETYPRLVPYQAGHPNKQLGKAKIRILFGPYLSHRYCQGMLDFSQDQFQLRNCYPLANEACLRFHLRQCGGICEQRVTDEKYSEDVSKLIDFLSNKPGEVIRMIRSQMVSLAENLEYERAQRLKELLAVLEGALVRQAVERVVDHNQVAIYCGEQGALVASIQKGSVVGMNLVALDSKTDKVAALEALFRRQSESDWSNEVIVNQPCEAELVVKALGGTRSQIVRTPLGEENDLMDLCRINYEYRIGMSAQGIR